MYAFQRLYGGTFKLAIIDINFLKCSINCTRDFVINDFYVFHNTMKKIPWFKNFWCMYIIFYLINISYACDFVRVIVKVFYPLGTALFLDKRYQWPFL